MDIMISVPEFPHGRSNDEFDRRTASTRGRVLIPRDRVLIPQDRVPCGTTQALGFERAVARQVNDGGEKVASVVGSVFRVRSRSVVRRDRQARGVTLCGRDEADGTPRLKLRFLRLGVQRVDGEPVGRGMVDRQPDHPLGDGRVLLDRRRHRVTAGLDDGRLVLDGVAPGDRVGLMRATTGPGSSTDRERMPVL